MELAWVQRGGAAMIRWMAAAAAAGLLASGGAARATTFDLGNVVPDQQAASLSVSAPDATQLDRFTFDLQSVDPAFLYVTYSVLGGFADDVGSVIISVGDNRGLVIANGTADVTNGSSFSFGAIESGGSDLLRITTTGADASSLAYSISVEAETIIAPPPPAAPEPGTWALLVAGVGLAGVALRGRSRQLTA